MFLAMVLLLILTILGLGLMFNASVENTLAGTSTKISKVFYAADSGVEYAGAMLSSTLGYAGGAMPVTISAYPSPGSPDIHVTVARPVLIQYEIGPGEQFESKGSGYGSVQVVEAVYAVTSTASSTEIQASKTIDAAIGVYPRQLSTPQ